MKYTTTILVSDMDFLSTAATLNLVTLVILCRLNQKIDICMEGKVKAKASFKTKIKACMHGKKHHLK